MAIKYEDVRFCDLRPGDMLVHKNYVKNSPASYMVIAIDNIDRKTIQVTWLRLFNPCDNRMIIYSTFNVASALMIDYKRIVHGVR